MVAITISRHFVTEEPGVCVRCQDEIPAGTYTALVNGELYCQRDVIKIEDRRRYS
jgi:hypothetical protein